MSEENSTPLAQAQEATSRKRLHTFTAYNETFSLSKAANNAFLLMQAEIKSLENKVSRLEEQADTQFEDTNADIVVRLAEENKVLNTTLQIKEAVIDSLLTKLAHHVAHI